MVTMYISPTHGGQSTIPHDQIGLLDLLMWGRWDGGQKDGAQPLKAAMFPPNSRS